jgi:hypothetical protein
MKFAVLNSDTAQNRLSDAETNVGAIYMTRSVMNIYSELGIPQDMIVEIKACEVEDYDGEDVILPICIHIPRSHENNSIFKASLKIKPVFLAISMTETKLTEEQINLLKSNQPIGCRDEHTLSIMKNHGINGYLMGCLVTSLPKGVRNINADKVIFSDVPVFAHKYVPEGIKKDVIFVKQEITLDELPDGIGPSEYADMIMSVYKNDARLVVTSRFHAAALAIAYKIPYILITEAYTYRFSWLKRYGNFYTRENAASINWDPGPLDFSVQKRLMKQLAKSQILDALNSIDENNIVMTQNEPSRLNPKDFEKASHNLFNLLSYNDWANVGLIDYYDGAIDFIEKHWQETENTKYAFWGVNNNVEAIYEYITEKYPNAKLVKVYDSKQTIIFRDIISETPENISKNDNIIIFVTTFVAKSAAAKLFNERGLCDNSYYLCDREYINEATFDN